MPPGLNPLSDLAPLAIALAGLREDAAFAGAGPRAPIDAVARLGYRAVILDAAAHGLRPRELDRSARRDLAAALRRMEVAFAGLDLWIPPSHFADPAHADRAAVAVGEALELAADLARGVGAGSSLVSVALPRGLEGDRSALFDGVLSGLLARADKAGATLVDHALPLGACGESDLLGVGIDPASLLLRDADPVGLTGKHGAHVRVARWSDADTVSRIAPSMTGARGRLDWRAYAMTVAAATPAKRLVLDLRGVPEAFASAGAVARTLW